MKAIQTAKFYGLDFEVTPDVLNPYSATERLVTAAIERQPKRFIDVGTGSGNIVVSMLKALPDSTAIATDISPAALLVAKANAEKHGVGDRVEFVVSDALDAIRGQFEAVVCNSPYSPTAGCLPDIAYTDGVDGLSVIRRLIDRSRFSLVHRGRLLFECYVRQLGEIVVLFSGWDDVVIQFRGQIAIVASQFR
jgi:release factor glutamine methyltransferase